MSEGEDAVTGDHFVDPSFVPPEGLDTPDFRLRPLGPEHNVSDYAAWTSSIEHIHASPGWEGSDWPMPMTLEANLGDLEGHAADFAARTGFTYTVLAPDADDVIGCVYIYPAEDGPRRPGTLLGPRERRAPRYAPVPGGLGMARSRLAVQQRDLRGALTRGCARCSAAHCCSQSWPLPRSRAHPPRPLLRQPLPPGRPEPRTPRTRPARSPSPGRVAEYRRAPNAFDPINDGPLIYLSTDSLASCLRGGTAGHPELGRRSRSCL